MISPEVAWGEVGSELDPQTGLYPMIMPTKEHYDWALKTSRANNFHRRASLLDSDKAAEVRDRVSKRYVRYRTFVLNHSLDNNEFWDEETAELARQRMEKEALDELIEEENIEIMYNPAILASTEYEVEIESQTEAEPIKEKHYSVKFDLMRLGGEEGVQDYREILGNQLYKSYGLTLDISQSTLEHVYRQVRAPESSGELDSLKAQKFLYENIGLIFEYVKADYSISKVDISTGWTADSSPSRYGGNLPWMQKQFMRQRRNSNGEVGHNVVMAVDNLAWGTTRTNQIADGFEAEVAISASQQGELENDSFPGSSKHSAVAKRRVMSWQDGKGQLQGIKGKWIHMTHSTGEKEGMYLTTMMSQEEKENSFFFNFAGVGRVEEDLTRTQELLLESLVLRSYAANKEIWNSKGVEIGFIRRAAADLGISFGILSDSEEGEARFMSIANDTITTQVALGTTKKLPGGKDFLLGVHGDATTGKASASSFHTIAQMYDWLAKIQPMSETFGYSDAVFDVEETILRLQGGGNNEQLDKLEQKRTVIQKSQQDQIEGEEKAIRRGQCQDTTLYRSIYSQRKTELSLGWGKIDPKKLNQDTMANFNATIRGKTNEEIVALNHERRKYFSGNQRGVDGGIKLVNFLSRNDALVPQDQRLTQGILTGETFVSNNGDHYSGFVTACSHDLFRNFFYKALDFDGRKVFHPHPEYFRVKSFELYRDQELKVDSKKTTSVTSEIGWDEVVSKLSYDLDKVIRLFPDAHVLVGKVDAYGLEESIPSTDLTKLIRQIESIQEDTLIADFFQKLRIRQVTRSEQSLQDVFVDLVADVYG